MGAAQGLYFDDYSPIGDILVIAVCVVMIILVAASYVNNTRAFRMFLSILKPVPFAVVTISLMSTIINIIDERRITGTFILISSLCSSAIYKIITYKTEKRNT